MKARLMTRETVWSFCVASINYANCLDTIISLLHVSRYIILHLIPNANIIIKTKFNNEATAEL